MRTKNKLLVIFLLSSAFISLSSHADLLDSLKNATDLVKKTGILDKVSPQNAGVLPNTGSTKQNNSGASTLNDELPMGLTIYPNAELVWRVDNPFDQVNMPISVPRSIPPAKTTVTYVPTQGKVTMLSFLHQDSDSPLLIQKHYESWLASNGFERMMVCQAPCHAAAESTDWINFIDPLQKMDSNYVPKKATVIAAYKDNAMALVMVGQYLFAYSSFVKVVDGQVLDNSNWKKLMKPSQPLPVVEPSKYAPAAQANTAANVYAQQVLPNDLLTNVESSRGPVLVHLSSSDKSCSFCVKANPNFNAIAKRYKGKDIQFWQSGAQVWRESLSNDFAKKYQIGGVPTTLLFQDGQLIEQVSGLASAEELENKLIVATNALGKTEKPRPTVTPTPKEPNLAAQDNDGVSSVQAISGNEALSHIRSSKGVIFVQVSSYDKRCKACTSAMASFDELADRYAGKGEFLQITTQPWSDAIKNDFARAYNLSAAPATMVFKDGQLARTVIYNAATADELDNKLVK